MGCKGLKKDGAACGMRPPAGQDFCLNHGGTKPVAKPAAKPAAAEAPAKVAGKAAKASPDARSGEGWGVAAGALVGVLLAGAIVYAARRFLGAAPAGGAAPRNLRAVGT